MGGRRALDDHSIHPDWKTRNHRNKSSTQDNSLHGDTEGDTEGRLEGDIVGCQVGDCEGCFVGSGVMG
eukprot:scaffold47757_cov66-Cyclotella_meneghiniana.AAC.2